MKRVSELMQEIQTVLVKAGLSEKDAVTFTEHRVAHVHRDETTSVGVCARLEATLACAKIEPAYAISGGFVWAETPEDHNYWSDLSCSLRGAYAA